MQKHGRDKRSWTIGDSDIPSVTSQSKMAISYLIDDPDTSYPTSTVPTPKLELSPQFQNCVHVPVEVLRRGLRIEDYALDVRQQPIRGKAAGESERFHADRNVVDPPPVVQLTIHDGDPMCDWLHSSFFIMCASLCDPTIDIPVSLRPNEALAGTLVSPLHHVHNEMDRDEGHFIFSDISIKFAGQFRLRFNLFELLDGEQFEFITSILSDVFTVYSSQPSPELLKSTVLSRGFSQSSICLRSRNETGASTVLMDDDTEAVAQKAPRGARSESKMEVSTASPAAMVVPFSQRLMLQKLAHTTEARESSGAGHAGRSLKGSALSAVSNSSAYGSPVSLSGQSAASSNSRSWRGGLGAAQSDKRHILYSRKNTSDGRWQQFTALLSLYKPRHEHQYYVPIARSPMLAAAHGQRYREYFHLSNYKHGRSAASGLVPSPPASIQRYITPMQQDSLYTIPVSSGNSTDAVLQPPQTQLGGFAHSTPSTSYSPQFVDALNWLSSAPPRQQGTRSPLELTTATRVGSTGSHVLQQSSASFNSAINGYGHS
ncbi:velvet factor-domain-containing protein [Lipomyces starkeyi]